MRATLDIEDLAHGGDGVGRLDGKVVFVPGTVTGESVEVEIVQDRRDFARARLVRIIEASPKRIDPPCPHFADCGGCQWQFLDRSDQAEAKRATLVGQLQHLGRVDQPPVGDMLLPGPDFRYRNRMDFSVAGGSPALKAWRSSREVPIDRCLLLVDPLAELFERLGDLTGVEGVTLRHGAGSGQSLVVLHGRLPEQAPTWGVPVVNTHGDSLVGTRGHVEEHVAGADFRVSGTAFFQNNTAGAAALVTTVADLLDVDRSDRLLDGYSGVGLFACTVGTEAGSVLCVEADDTALPDLEVNLERAAVPAPEVLIGPFEDTDGEAWTVAVVDPPRTGLRRIGVEAVLSSDPRAVAYVSCDPAGLSRDTRYFAELGYRLMHVVPVDVFAQTFHIEAVALFRPA